MRDLTRDELQYLSYFIRFCDGIYDVRGGVRRLLCGSGRGSAWAGEAFNGGDGDSMLGKALRRGLLSKSGPRWSPTEAGRALTGVEEPR